MEDAARAIQYLRAHASEWNLDAQALAASGGSSGAVISLWIAFHDDMAGAQASDPVQRQSTRVAVAGVVDAQATFDPREIATVIDEKTARIAPIAQFYGVPKGVDPLTLESKFALYADGSPMHHLNAGDPPVFAYYTTPYRELPAMPNSESIHNPRFGFYLKKRMDELGIDCVVKLARDYTGERRQLMSVDMVNFFQKYLAPR